MVIQATQAFGRMPGGSQSQLMLCSDNNLWVVKFKNNPQHTSVLPRQFVASCIARAIGLSVPRSAIVNVSEDLIASGSDLCVVRCSGMKERCSSGLNLGSQFVGTLMPGQTVRHIVDSDLKNVLNLTEFAGALILDIWTRNTDLRQAIFVRHHYRSQRFRVKFIDFGYCISLCKWQRRGIHFRGFYKRPEVYKPIREWDDFQPWLDRVKFFDPSILWRLVQEVPDEWLEGNRIDLEHAVDNLIDRGRNISGLLSAYIDANANMFNSSLYQTGETTRHC